MYGEIKDYRGYTPRQYRMIDGALRETGDPEVIAFCVSHTHQNFLTQGNIREHQCFFKRCPYLRKLADNPYWSKPHAEYRTQINKRYQPEAQRYFRFQKQRWDNLAAERCREIKDFCNQWTIDNSLEDLFLVTSVSRFEKSTKNFRVFYVSPTSEYDAPHYVDLARAIQENLGFSVLLVHVKDEYGRRVTLAEYKRRKR